MTKNYPVRREHPRFNVDIQVGVTVADAKFAARTRDMSRVRASNLASATVTATRMSTLKRGCSRRTG